jgi:hypothetical protein
MDSTYFCRVSSFGPRPLRSYISQLTLDYGAGTHLLDATYMSFDILG